ncbi:MAG TPA: hypothetical protein PL033_11595 [Candidatus Brocadiia bacterium]|nr:hypothetical protein [Candidatus Brocadiia bacterium]
MALSLLIGLACFALNGFTDEEKKMSLDLTNAVVVAPKGLSARERKAVDMLLDEAERRSRIRWSLTYEWPAGAAAVVAVGSRASLLELTGAPLAGMIPASAPAVAEGFSLSVRRGEGGRPIAVAAGNDERGVLFGIGRLLREFRMSRDRIEAPREINISTAPKYRIRGHQLGYRPKTNSYDAWTAAMWEQYFRDLAVFGANAIELIPPRSDDDADSPHFPLPPIEMMKQMSRLADEYGLDVWVWYPAMDRDYGNPDTVAFALKEWGAVFEQLPRINAVFVPGGDPGHTQPKHMFALLEKQTEVLHRTHPDAQMWMSPQSFNGAWMDEFHEILSREQPKWLSGIVFGPQNRTSLEELRAKVPAQYPIRHYPDITHTFKCQFPAPDWDIAFAFTEDREPINPRPADYANAIRLTAEYTDGFITYSEGCNDDVNKAVWACLGWDPDMPLIDALRQYSRYFIGPQFEDDFAQGLLALERNWQGPILTNRGIFATLALFQDMERRAGPQELLKWRFQQALYRAYYDTYVARRFAHEAELERRAMDALGREEKIGSISAMREAETILDQAVLAPVAGELRARVFELAEALFQSARMQLSVPRYKAIDAGRGANLDFIDSPLNDAAWLKARFAEIRALPEERERRAAIEKILNWTDPGPGGFYDDLGDATRQPHLVRDPQAAAGQAVPWRDDPEFRRVSLVGFQRNSAWRMSWRRHAEARYDSPLVMRYDNLDPAERYRVRVVYAGDEFRFKVRLCAGDGIEIHPYMIKPMPIAPLEFDIPREAVSGGSLTLTWTGEPGRGGNGRCCQVAEVWLIKTR